MAVVGNKFLFPPLRSKVKGTTVGEAPQFLCRNTPCMSQTSVHEYASVFPSKICSEPCSCSGAAQWLWCFQWWNFATLQFLVVAHWKWNPSGLQIPCRRLATDSTAQHCEAGALCAHPGQTSSIFVDTNASSHSFRPMFSKQVCLASNTMSKAAESIPFLTFEHEQEYWKKLSELTSQSVKSTNAKIKQSSSK